ncbi:hypothetical protein BH10PSE14_BH10PSE14_23860 [soil metagenome]
MAILTLVLLMLSARAQATAPDQAGQAISCAPGDLIYRRKADLPPEAAAMLEGMAEIGAPYGTDGAITVENDKGEVVEYLPGSAFQSACRHRNTIIVSFAQGGRALIFRTLTLTLTGNRWLESR